MAAGRHVIVKQRDELRQWPRTRGTSCRGRVRACLHPPSDVTSVNDPAGPSRETYIKFGSYTTPLAKLDGSTRLRYPIHNRLRLYRYEKGYKTWLWVNSFTTQRLRGVSLRCSGSLALAKLRAGWVAHRVKLLQGRKGYDEHLERGGS